MKQPSLYTERLLLRAFRLSDAAIVQKLAGAQAIADTTRNIPHPYEDGVAEAWIKTLGPGFRTGQLATFAIIKETPGKLIGAIGLRIDARHDCAELGYWVGEQFWDQGFCTEAAQRLVDYAFAERNLQRIFAVHLERNPASGRVLRKIGMTRESHAIKYAKKSDRPENLVAYELLRREWADEHRA